MDAVLILAPAAWVAPVAVVAPWVMFGLWFLAMLFCVVVAWRYR